MHHFPAPSSKHIGHGRNVSVPLTGVRAWSGEGWIGGVFGGEVPIPRQEIVDAVDGMIGDTGEQRPEEDPIHAERKRRADVSLFASNVALSYRKPRMVKNLTRIERAWSPVSQFSRTAGF